MMVASPSRSRVPGPWWWLVLAVVALPILGSGLQRHSDGWYPESDDATITLLARDVLSSDPPLLGMVSTGGDGLDDPELHHPGPLELYLLAPFTRFPGGPVPATTIVVVALALAAVATIGLALRRLGGDGAGLVGLLAAGLAVWGVGGDLPASVWNPDVVALPFGALLAVTAAVASGRHRWWPVLVVLASFVAQTHLSYVGLVGMLVLWAAVVTAVDGWRLRRSDEATAAGLARSLVIAAVIALVLWAPPLVQQVTGSPGNLSQIVRSLTGPGGDPVGAAGGAVLADVVGLPLLGASPPGDLVVDVAPFGVGDGVRLAVPFALAVVVALLARRRGDGAGARVALTVLVALVAGLVTATRMPLADGLLYRYYGRWMWPLGAVSWALLVLAVLPSVRARLAATAASSPGPARRVGPAVVGAALAVTAAAVLAALPRPGAWAPWQAQRRAAGDVAETAAIATRRTGAEHAVVRFRGGTAFLSTGSAVAVALETEGLATTMDAGFPLDVIPWGDHRDPERTPGDAAEVWVVTGPRPVDLPGSARAVAHADLLTGAERRRIAAATRRWRASIVAGEVTVGDRRPTDAATSAAVADALADPVAAFDERVLGDLAARGLVQVPGGDVDDLYTLDRLRSLAAEDTVEVFVVPRP